MPPFNNPESKFRKQSKDMKVEDFDFDKADTDKEA